MLKKRRRILGEEHPDTISAMNNLANTLGDQGQLNEAATMLKEVLEKMRRILGEEHPDTISAMNNLAFTLEDQGQLDEAIALLKVAIQRMKQIHRNKHPYTRTASRNLAGLSASLASAEKLQGGKSSKKGGSLLLESGEYYVGEAS
jgi:tetratricopeptide (TPR) repeat protein